MPPKNKSVLASRQLHRCSSSKKCFFVLLACASVATFNFLFGGNQFSLRKFPTLVSDTWGSFAWNVQAVRTYSLEEIHQILNLTKESEPMSSIGRSNSSDGLRWEESLHGTSGEELKENFTMLFSQGAKCPPVPPTLIGRVEVKKADVSWENIFGVNKDLEPGGRFKPRDCVARNKVAIIVPYRDRASHLRIFLHNLHPMLKRQQLDYGIYVIDQADGRPFNRAMLFNVGFLEAGKIYDYDCFIFHDVDLIPEDDRNLYSCPLQPRHMSVAIDDQGYKLPYDNIFGGVSALTVDQFVAVNGFSNKFWGWGGEDDEMFDRLQQTGLQITRYPLSIARYTALKHSKAKPNPRRYHLLHAAKHRMSVDGLNSVRYDVLDVVMHKLYTTISVRLLPS